MANLSLLLGPALLGFGLALAGCGDDAPAPAPSNPTPKIYEGCSVSSSTCPSPTTCAASLATAAAPNTGYCSRTCAIDADCPADPGGRTKICSQPKGATAAQCYTTCPSASSVCPTGTTCKELKTQSDTSLRLCAP